MAISAAADVAIGAAGQVAITAPVIQVRGAAFQYGNRSIFAAIDLDVYAGQVITILGPNGCGKSTLLRCIGGVLALARGSVRMGEAAVAALGPSARARKIGLLFQDHTPTFPFSVLDVALMGRTPYMNMLGSPTPQDAVLAQDSLRAVGMLGAQYRPYTELSGGERQLVLLARTLAQQPEVILLDEPTAHLDLKNQVACLRSVRELAAQGRAMIMSTHDPNHAFRLPGQVILMKGDGTVAIGIASGILTGEALSRIYGTPIKVFSMQGREGSAEQLFCSPW